MVEKPSRNTSRGDTTAALIRLRGAFSRKVAGWTDAISRQPCFEDMFERAFPPAEPRLPLMVSFDDEDG